MLLECYDSVFRQLHSCASIQFLIVRPDNVITVIYYALIRIQRGFHWSECKISNRESVEKNVIYLSFLFLDSYLSPSIADVVLNWQDSTISFIQFESLLTGE